MAKARFTLTIDDHPLRDLNTRAAESGKSRSEFIEDTLCRHLGFELLGRFAQRSGLAEGEAADLAVEAQHRSRH